MKLIITLIIAAFCAGLAVPDLALAKNRSSGRSHQSSGSHKSDNDSSNPGYSAGSRSSRHAIGKSYSAAKPAPRGKAKSHASSPTKPDVDRGNQGRSVSGSKARSDFQKARSCPSTGKSGGACPDDVTDNGTAMQRTERTRNEQISSTKALAKLYMHKAK